MLAVVAGLNPGVDMVAPDPLGLPEKVVRQVGVAKRAVFVFREPGRRW